MQVLLLECFYEDTQEYANRQTAHRGCDNPRKSDPASLDHPEATRGVPRPNSWRLAVQPGRVGAVQ